jgi:hypothetical protein
MLGGEACALSSKPRTRQIKVSFMQLQIRICIYIEAHLEEENTN